MLFEMPGMHSRPTLLFPITHLHYLDYFESSTDISTCTHSLIAV